MEARGPRKGARPTEVGHPGPLTCFTRGDAPCPSNAEPSRCDSLPSLPPWSLLLRAWPAAVAASCPSPVGARPTARSMGRHAMPPSAGRDAAPTRASAWKGRRTGPAASAATVARYARPQTTAASLHERVSVPGRAPRPPVQRGAATFKVNARAERHSRSVETARTRVRTAPPKVFRRATRRPTHAWG
jgi:hypothetical protein